MGVEKDRFELRIKYLDTSVFGPSPASFTVNHFELASLNHVFESYILTSP